MNNERFFSIVNKSKIVEIGFIEKAEPRLSEEKRYCENCSSVRYGPDGLYCCDSGDYVGFNYSCKHWGGAINTRSYSIYNNENIYEIIHFGNWTLYEIEPLTEIIRRGHHTYVDKFKYVKKINIDDFSEKLKVELIKGSGDWIKKIKHPSENIQRIALSHNPWFIEYIENPSEGRMFQAIRSNFATIERIKNAPIDIQKFAIRESKYAIDRIKNPSDKIIEYQKRVWNF